MTDAVVVPTQAPPPWLAPRPSMRAATARLAGAPSPRDLIRGRAIGTTR